MSKNAKGFVAAVVLALVAAAVVVAGFVTSRGAAATLGLIFLCGEEDHPTSAGIV